MPQLDFSTYLGQIFWLFITFSILFILMRYVVTPRLVKIFEAREVEMKTLLDKAEHVQKEAQNLIQLDQEKLKQAREDVQKKIQLALEEARREKERHHHEMDAYFQQKLEETDKNLFLLKQKALQEADCLKEDLVKTLSQKFLEDPHV